MNEGGMIKTYVERAHIDTKALASAIGVQQSELNNIYQSQTVEPEMKKKLESFFRLDIFDGTLLMEAPMNVPDQQANKAEI